MRSVIAILPDFTAWETIHNDIVHAPVAHSPYTVIAILPDFTAWEAIYLTMRIVMNCHAPVARSHSNDDCFAVLKSIFISDNIFVMESVLILDAPPLFREFVKDRLATEKIKVEIAESRRDAFPKCLSLVPDLIIINIEKSIYDVSDFLDKKISNPNTKNIPIIACCPVLPRATLDKLVPYGLMKYFIKPLRFDAFFRFLERNFSTAVFLDATPCIIDIHITNNLLFVEISEGLNHDKLFLLQYLISEVLDQTKLTNPKVIVMITGVTLSFVDVTNLEVLFDGVIADKRVHKHNVTVLAFDKFIHDVITGHEEYQGFSFANDLQSISHNILDKSNNANLQEAISENVLVPTMQLDINFIDINYTPTDNDSQGENKTSRNKKFALVDDDAKTLDYLKGILKNDAEIETFSNGTDFLAATAKTKFDLTILDLIMPGYSGLDVLKILRNKGYIDPVIIYSENKDKNNIMGALTLGAKAFLAKPSSPERILTQIDKVFDNENEF